MTAKREIEKAYRNATPVGGFVKIIDIIEATDIRPEEFAAALRVLYSEGWSMIPNSQGGDVTETERRYCPMIGRHQVHLISK